MTSLHVRLLVALLAVSTAGSAVLPRGAAAQSVPSYAHPAAQPQETVHGTVTSFDGTQNVVVNDDRGFLDTIVLRRNTVINPSGTQLAPGMRVTIVGINRGSALAATQIDVLGLPVPPPAAIAPPPGLAPAPGTVLTGILTSALDSKSAYAGEPVVISNVATRDGSVGSGARLSGMVTDVTRPAQGRNAQIRIHFDTLHFADGTSAPVDGVVVSMQVKTKNNAGKEVAGALAGMLVGNALAKTILGASGGGVVGAVGGYLIAKDNRADVTIPAQTAITVRLADARRQAPS